MLGSWWLSPAGSRGARPGQPHEPQLIHTPNAMHTHRPSCSPARICCTIAEPKTGCVRKRWCWMIVIITHRARCNGYNSLMQIKIDMLFIIFKLARPPRGFAHSSAKLAIIMRVKGVLPVFPKATVDHMLM